MRDYKKALTRRARHGVVAGVSEATVMIVYRHRNFHYSYQLAMSDNWLCLLRCAPVAVLLCSALLSTSVHDVASILQTSQLLIELCAAIAANLWGIVRRNTCHVNHLANGEFNHSCVLFALSLDSARSLPECHRLEIGITPSVSSIRLSYLTWLERRLALPSCDYGSLSPSLRSTVYAR